MNLIASPLIRLSASPSLWDSMVRRRAAAMSSSIQSDGWLRTSLESIDWRRAMIASLPLLASSKRVRARDGVGEEGGGSELSGVCGEGSGEEAGRV